MKTKKLELDVDFIGVQEPLTAEEENALKEYFKKRKQTSKKPFDRNKIKPVIQKKEVA